jgi:hypothetical protein
MLFSVLWRTYATLDEPWESDLTDRLGGGGRTGPHPVLPLVHERLALD